MKIINKKVDSCSDCPYLRYDPDKSYESGYDCDKKDRRIIDDYDYSNLNNPTRLILTTDKIPIPDWCPLEDVVFSAKNCSECNKYLGDLAGWENPLTGKNLCDDCYKKLKKRKKK